MSLTIETERLVLRQFLVTDAKAASHNSGTPNVAHFMSDMVLTTEEAALKWINWITNEKFDVDKPCIVLAVVRKETDTPIGLVGVAPKAELCGEIEVLFSIADEYQNKGYVTEAAGALLQWVFENDKSNGIVAIVKHDNVASNRVVHKLGFAYAGERNIDYDGKMTDFHYYRLWSPSKFKIISIRENSEYAIRAIDYFSSKWGKDRRIYDDCITHCLTSASPLPQWYLMVDENDAIIGCYGLITNDFISRQDLWPWLCALYIEEHMRGKALGSVMLTHGRREAVRLGFDKLYLCTDHIGYYEKYGWRHIDEGFHPWGDSSRIYEIDSIKE